MGRAGAILRPILPSLRSDSVVQARCLLRRPEVIAVTYRQDLGADLVVAECYRRGIDIWRFNTEDFPATVGITLNPANPYQTLFVSDRAEISFETAAHGLGTEEGVGARTLESCCQKVAGDPSGRNHSGVFPSESLVLGVASRGGIGPSRHWDRCQPLPRSGPAICARSLGFQRSRWLGCLPNHSVDSSSLDRAIS